MLGGRSQWVRGGLELLRYWHVQPEQFAEDVVAAESSVLTIHPKPGEAQGLRFQRGELRHVWFQDTIVEPDTVREAV